MVAGGFALLAGTGAVAAGLGGAAGGGAAVGAVTLGAVVTGLMPLAAGGALGVLGKKVISVKVQNRFDVRSYCGQLFIVFWCFLVFFDVFRCFSVFYFVFLVIFGVSRCF